jgi:N-acetylmuramoyl-L-alanine amidase
MPKCPFAVWKPFDGSPGGYAAGHSFKIVHHTTEGSSADGAFLEYRKSKNIPHFTVDDMTIYQHVDTAKAASALRHPAGTTETNRSSAVQIELVGFAGLPKSPASLENMARLCRWIEATHGVPSDWPNGPPSRLLMAEIQATTIGINRTGTAWVGIMAIATCPTTCIGIPHIPATK